ncbi:MAG: hypothetical protein ACRDPO_29535 [Streptosporangiaceae bacterium]
MPGIKHEAPIELLRRNPLLAAALLEGSGVSVPADGTAVMVAGDLSSALPAELRADAVIVLGGNGPDAWTGTRLAVVVESQTAPAADKRRVWPAYLALARAQHDCPAVLVVICPSPATGRWARQPIRTGHPGFDLVPLVIDAGTTPAPDAPGLAGVSPELAVLGALTGAVDLEQDAGRRLVLRIIAAASLDEDRLETYTHLIRVATPAAARGDLEALMTTTFKDEFIDRIKAEGKAEGKAESTAAILLRLLATRGVKVPAPVRDRVLSCTDLSQLDAWVVRAMTASTLEDVFPD